MADSRMPPEQPTEAIITIPVDQQLHTHNRTGRWQQVRNCITPSLLWAGAITNALYQGSSNGIQLFQMNQKMLLIVPASTLFFVTNLRLSRKFNIDGTEEISQFLSSGLPDDNDEWPKISKLKEVAAICSATALTAIACYVNGAQVYLFAESLPKDLAFTIPDSFESATKTAMIISSTFVASDFLLSQGRLTYKYLRKLLSNNPIHFANNFSKFYSIPFIAIGIGSTLTNSLVNLSCITFYEHPEVWVNLALSLLDGIGFFCVNGRYAIDLVDGLCGYLADKSPTKSQVAALLLSASLASIIAYAQFILTDYNLKAIEKGMGIEAPIITLPIITAFSALYSIGGHIVDTGAFYDLTQPVIESIGNRLITVKDAIANRLCTSAVNDTDEANEQRPLLAHKASNPSIASNPNSLFGQPQNSAINAEANEPELKKPSKRCGCQIL